MSFKVALIVFSLVITFKECYARPQNAVIDPTPFFCQVEPGPLIEEKIADDGSVPYQVALTTGRTIRALLCGASIITATHVLTAAHCVNSVYLRGALISTFRGLIGTNNWTTGGTSLTFTSNITHPNYIVDKIKNDISILITSSPIDFTERAQPIPLGYDFIGSGILSRIAGWGRLEAEGANSEMLVELFPTTITGDNCIAEILRHATSVNVFAPPVEPDIELCTFHSINRGTCNGDSGGALVEVRTGLQIGIVSWGFPCGRGAPDIFVRISAFRDFIENVIN